MEKKLIEMDKKFKSQFMLPENAGKKRIQHTAVGKKPESPKGRHKSPIESLVKKNEYLNLKMMQNHQQTGT